MKPALILVIGLAATPLSAQEAEQAEMRPAPAQGVPIDQLLEPGTVTALVELGVLDPERMPGLLPPQGVLPDAESVERALGAALETSKLGTLDRVACGDGRCGAALAIAPAERPEAIPEGLLALEQALTELSPCGYTVAMPGLPDPEDGGSMVITIDCDM